MNLANLIRAEQESTILDKATAIWIMGKPKFTFTMGLMAFLGSICSPNFMNPLFPETFLAEMGVLGSKPLVWSIGHAIGAVIITMFVWMGTAILNDYCDEKIDKISNKDRPLQTGIISKDEVLQWVKFLFGIPIILTWLEGDKISFAFVVFTIIIGIMYSVPPFRLRNHGLIANLIIGFGIGGAFLGGAKAEFSISLNEIVSACVFSILIMAISSTKDFKDMEGDRLDGVKTLPVTLGYEKAILINIIFIIVGYGLATLPMILSSNWIYLLGVFTCFILNLIALFRLFSNRSLMYRRKALSIGLSCFLGVVILYVFAQY